MLMLYLMQGMPAAAQFLIIVCTASMSRSRCGLWPSMIAGFRSRSMWLDGEVGRRQHVDADPLVPLDDLALLLELVHRRVQAPVLGDLAR